MFDRQGDERDERELVCRDTEDEALSKRPVPQRHAIRVAQPIRAGWGHCSSSGCPCRAFQGGGDLCTNCGHQYRDHW
jgi:hypothetical protein